MGILDGNPKKEPLHYGEIMGIWSFAMNGQGMKTTLQTFKNHAGDKDLRQFIDDLYEDMDKEVLECTKLLKDNGIAPPPSYPEKPKANLEDIPAGARFSDPEIAAGLVKEMATSLVTCSQVIGQSIREDVGMLFVKYHTSKVTMGARLLKMNKEKAWLIAPPLQMKQQEPITV